MKTQVHAAQPILYHAAWVADQHAPCAAEPSMATLAASEAASFVALEAQPNLGAHGYSRDLAMERYVRDALLSPIGGGSIVMQRNNIFKP